MRERSALLLALPLLLAGCLAIPIPLGEGHVSAGREVPQAAEATLALGRSTRAEVQAALGPPSATWDEHGILIYDWDRVRWVVLLAIAGMGGGAAGLLELPDHHMLLLQFDEAGVLRRLEHAQRPSGTSYGDALRRFAGQDPAPPAPPPASTPAPAR